MKIRTLLLAATATPLWVFAHDGAHTVARDAPSVAGADETHTMLSAPGRREASSTPDARDRAARLFFSDRRLLTQHGDEVRFYSDVLKDRVVLINFVFTQCKDTCPTQTAKVSAVQTLLDGTEGRDVQLVSISVDPRHDTPAALARYATTFGAGAQWTFLTGRRDDVDDVLRRLGQWTADPRTHTTLFIAGNAATGHWMKLHPDLTPARIAAELRALAAETPPARDAPATGALARPPPVPARSTNIDSH